MLMWAMSDRAIPRSFRMMEGFGVHTFRMVDAKGKSTFVKFHWRPSLGTFSLTWDEAVKIAGADPDFHRRDLWDAIENGVCPEWELSVQAFTAKEAEKFDFDVLDPTKLIPEEIVPLRPLGRMVLDRNVDNFFAETEQVAFCPSHLVPGIDFSNDPLLQGRLHSYLDTQLTRLGGPNFHQIPINRPKCPMGNFQRDGNMQQSVPKGRVSYDPSSLDSEHRRENPEAGFKSVEAHEEGLKLRQRPESFADHYSQARLFWKSMTEPEQRHIVAAFGFELGKCESTEIRERMLGHLAVVADPLCRGVAEKLGMAGKVQPARPAVKPFDMEPSPALSQVQKAPDSLAGKTIALLVTDGFPSRVHNALKKAAKAEDAQIAIVGLTPGTIETDRGKDVATDHFLAGAPSVLFDAVVVAPGPDSIEKLLDQPAAIDWVRDAFVHLKVIGLTKPGIRLLDKAGLGPALAEDEAVVTIEGSDTDSFIEHAKKHRHWEREERL
ncbi:Catalase C [Planctomycetes bacterium Poly30]|uniref:catalase n=2 Tax=Saltatorellus ferox TaxID=2528018 RepID=A0A518F0L7_9BACT|nr:Catalase C [Planctomycetes bacterium Poly30]